MQPPMHAMTGGGGGARSSPYETGTGSVGRHTVGDTPSSSLPFPQQANPPVSGAYSPTTSSQQPAAGPTPSITGRGDMAVPISVSRQSVGSSQTSMPVSGMAPTTTTTTTTLTHPPVAQQPTAVVHDTATSQHDKHPRISGDQGTPLTHPPASDAAAVRPDPGQGSKPAAAPTTAPPTTQSRGATTSSPEVPAWKQRLEANRRAQEEQQAAAREAQAAEDARRAEQARLADKQRAEQAERDRIEAEQRRADEAAAEEERQRIAKMQEQELKASAGLEGYMQRVLEKKKHEAPTTTTTTSTVSTTGGGANPLATSTPGAAGRRAGGEGLASSGAGLGPGGGGGARAGAVSVAAQIETARDDQGDDDEDYSDDFDESIEEEEGLSVQAPSSDGSFQDEQAW